MLRAAPHRTDPAAVDVAVVGAGLIGLAIAWRLRQAGRTVAVCDPSPGRGASWVAAGMLAPVTEVHYGEESLLRLNLAAADRWPTFAAELEAATGLPAGYRPRGTLAVAASRDDLTLLDELHAFHRRLGLASERLSARDCRAREPALAPAVRGGLLVPGDHQADPRRCWAALLAAAERAGVAFHREPVAALRDDGAQVTGVQFAGGDALAAERVVLAAGAWSARLANVPIRPVKGQLLRLHGDAGLTGTVRGLVDGRPVYIVPREAGRPAEIVIGATVEERGFDTTLTAGALHDVLRDALALVPGLADIVLTETLAGLRPGTPDNAPLIGPGPRPGLVLATGHFRNGVLLAPITADLVATSIVTGELPALAAPFHLARFAPQEVSA